MRTKKFSLKKYWIETNIFKNYFDAFLGIIVLICLPLCSLIMVFTSDNTGFWSYVFPLSSISLAGVYDAYGRYEKGAPQNFKLGTRVVLDFMAMFLAACVSNIDKTWKHYIPSIILLLSGGILLFEAINRIKTAIEISSWYGEIK